MNRILECFDRLRRSQKKGFIVYIGAGDPDLAATQRFEIKASRAQQFR